MKIKEGEVRLMAGFAFAQQDKKGCKDHPLFPKRVEGFYVGEIVQR